MAKYRPANDKKYRKSHKLHRRYLSYRSTARTFIKKYAKPNDISNLKKLWLIRTNHKNHYERVLIHKLMLNSEQLGIYMKYLANWKFGEKRKKDCLDVIGRLEALYEALICYDPYQKPFVTRLMNRANKLIVKANKYADTHK